MLAEVTGHRLAEIRRTRGLPQQQVADRMGVAKGRVSQIERGKVCGHDVLARSAWTPRSPGRQPSARFLSGIVLVAMPVLMVTTAVCVSMAAAALVVPVVAVLVAVTAVAVVLTVAVVVPAVVIAVVGRIVVVLAGIGTAQPLVLEEDLLDCLLGEVLAMLAPRLLLAVLHGLAPGQHRDGVAGLGPAGEGPT